MTTYAHVNDVKVGDILIADDGFTCLKNGEECSVHADDKGALYVKCAGEAINPDIDEKNCVAERNCEHYLDGQRSNEDKYIGLTKKC